MIRYFIKHYDQIDFDVLPVLLRLLPAPARNRRGRCRWCSYTELNPSNLVFNGGDLLAVIDWENAHIGDP